MDKMFTWAFFNKDHTVSHYLLVINIGAECVCHRLIFIHVFWGFFPRRKAVEASETNYASAASSYPRTTDKPHAAS